MPIQPRKRTKYIPTGKRLKFLDCETCGKPDAMWRFYNRKWECFECSKISFRAEYIKRFGPIAGTTAILLIIIMLLI